MKLIQKLCVVALLVVSVLQLKAQTFNEWRDPKLNKVNRVPMRSSFTAYNNAEAAIVGDKRGSDFKSLNGKWKFFFSPNVESRPTDFFEINYNDKSWVDFPVPAVWEPNGYGFPQYTNIGYAWRNMFENDPPNVPIDDNYVGSYRREIEVPQNWNGKDIFFHVGSATSNLYVWVNGEFVGYSEDSKLGAEFNITDFVKPGKNIIAMQIFRWCDGTYLEDQDFWRYSGIGRDVYMYARNENRIDDIKITPDLDESYRNGMLNVAMNLSDKASGTIDVSLTTLDGKLVASQSVNAVASKKAIAILKVTNPKKWSAEEPNLYQLIATLRGISGEIIEVIPQKVGFRKVEIKGNNVLVNGQPVLIKGANRHELDPLGGYVVSKERMEQDIIIMKNNNINAIRTCHYPNDPYWYELCDKYGIYLVDEANIESHGMGYGEETLANNPLYNRAHLERVDRVMQRDYNHPSVIFWSLGNEAGFGKNFIDAYYMAKEFDSSRPVQYERAVLNKETDIHVPMYADYEYMEKYANNVNETRPLIQCEYAHAMGNSQGGFKEYWDLIRKYPKLQGGFIWDYVDQSLRERLPDGRVIYTYGGDYGKNLSSDNNFQNNGLISPDRKLNPHMDEVSYFYQNIWVDGVDINNGIISVFNENFFVDLSNYRMKWTLIYDGTEVESGVITDLDIAPQESENIDLKYDISDYYKGKELLLNVEFETKKAENGVDASTVLARKQMIVNPYTNYSADLPASEYKATFKDNNIEVINVYGNGVEIDFSKEDGLIDLYKIDGLNYLEEGYSIRPSFWRAPTDNDFGGENLRNRFGNWREPGLQLEDIKASEKGRNVEVIAKYKLTNVDAELTLSYLINGEGAISMIEDLKVNPSSENKANLMRFGMEITMPQMFDIIDYYGRGTIENYVDRNTSAFIGRYKEDVKDQYYPYIRPQETGNKTDLRYWNVIDLDGRGLSFSSEAPISASALDRLTEDLDDGNQKDQRHGGEIDARPLTNIHVDKIQMGLGCENSWGALALDKYMIPYDNYTFKLLIKPTKKLE